MAISPLSSLLIGGGVSALEGIFGESEAERNERIQEQIGDLRDDQKEIYGEAMTGLAQHFSDVGTTFASNLNKYKDFLIQQAPARRAEIQEIFSEKNPSVARYIDNLRKSYKQAEKRVGQTIQRANQDEIRRFTQQGISGGTIGRTIAGNQLERLEKGEEILTKRMQEVLRPQAQIAQAGMGALSQAEQQQAGAGRQAGMAGVTTPVQLGAQLGGLQAGLSGQLLSSLGQLGQAQFAAQQQPRAPGLFEQAGAQFIGSGIERLLAPTPTT